MLNRALIEKEYDFLGDTIYLNVSLMSMQPKRTQQAFKGYIDGYTNTFASNQVEYFGEIMTSARQQIATLLSCDPSEVAFSRSTSDGITALANSFPFKQNDNVILTTEEHASNVVPWLALEKRGLEVRFAESHDGIVDITTIVEKMDEHTRIVSTSSTYFCSGYAIDLAALSSECHKRGIFLAIDGIQSLGRMKILPHELGVDYIAVGSYKGLLGIKGAGFIFCDKKLLPILQPYTGSMQGITNNERPFPLRHYSELNWLTDARKLEHGNYTYVVLQSLANSLSLTNELGIENIDSYIRHLEQYLRDKIAPLHMKMVDPPVKNRSGLLFIFYPEHAKVVDAQSILLKHHICASIRKGYIRMGLHFYNTEEQMNITAKALEEISKL